jgi:hypothetical protein
LTTNASHSNMAPEISDIKVPYNGCDSLLHRILT